MKRIDKYESSLLLSSVLIMMAPSIHAAAIPEGTQPSYVTEYDLNGDGKLDLIVTNYGDNTVSVLMGNGDGSFGAATSYAVGTTPYSITVADVNHDGNVDLAVANFNSSNVSVLLGNGDGTFGAATNYAAGTRPISVAVSNVSDLNDSNVDLIVANYGSNNVTVLVGNGDGTFGATLNYAVGTNPWSVTVSDVNADGHMDLLRRIGAAAMSVCCWVMVMLVLVQRQTIWRDQVRLP